MSLITTIIQRVKVMQDKLIDIHCHILPGIDDGPKTIDESFEMVQQAVEQGVGAIFATPHYIPGELVYEVEEVLERVRTLQEKIDEVGWECKIYPGMELYLCPELISHIDKGKVISLGKESKYLLVEFPGRELSPNLVDLLYEINIRGYIPIIAHPERNLGIVENPMIVNEILQHNVLLQVNASSLLGRNGKKSEKLAFEFVEQGLVSFVASDGHSPGRRAIHLRAAKDVLKLNLSNELFIANGKRVVSQKEVFKNGVEYRQRKTNIFSRLKKAVAFK